MTLSLHKNVDEHALNDKERVDLHQIAIGSTSLIWVKASPGSGWDFQSWEASRFPSVAAEMPVRKETWMTESTLERAFIVFFRLALGWTFLYAASHQVFVLDWSVVGFL